MDFRLDMYTLSDVFLSHSAWARRAFASSFCGEGRCVSTLPASLDSSESHKVSLPEFSSSASSSGGIWSPSSFSTSSLIGEVGGCASGIPSVKMSNLTVLGGVCRCFVILLIEVIVLGRVVLSCSPRSLLDLCIQIRVGCFSPHSSHRACFLANFISA